MSTFMDTHVFLYNLDAVRVYVVVFRQPEFLAQLVVSQIPLCYCLLRRAGHDLRPRERSRRARRAMLSTPSRRSKRALAVFGYRRVIFDAVARFCVQLGTDPSLYECYNDLRVVKRSAGAALAV